MNPSVRSVSRIPSSRSRPESLPAPTQALVDAILSLAGDLDLRGVLSRLVETAAALTGARYGALGVLGSTGELTEFITTGLDPAERAGIGPEPRGRGILGVLIADPVPLRLDDLNTHPAAVGMPPGHPVMTTFLGVPVHIRGTVFGNLYLTEKRDGLAFTAQDEVLVQALANAAALAIENARTYGLSERRRQWLEASAELVDALQPPITVEDALRAITSRVRTTAGATMTAIVQFPSDGHPVVAACDGVEEWEAANLVRRVIAAARTADERGLAIDVDLGTSYALVLPFQAHLADQGSLIAFFDRSAAEPTNEEREFVAGFVDQAALAFDRGQAVADREQLAVVSERARIARDLHDVVIQRLFAAGLKLQGVLRTRDPDQVAARVDSVVDDLDLTIADIRTTIFELQHPPDAVRTSIDRLSTDYAGVLGFKPAVRVSGPVDLVVTGALAENLLAVLREALSNVARHAGAGSVQVTVSADEDQVELRVVDDGIGISTERSESGLRNARERAAMLDGTLRVERNADRGTTLTWQCPLPAGR